MHEQQEKGFTRETTLAEKEEMFMFDSQNLYNLSEQKKEWIGYRNSMFQQSFLKLLRDEEKEMTQKVKEMNEKLLPLLKRRLTICNDYADKLQASKLKTESDPK
jgi:hypothetical protein